MAENVTKIVTGDEQSQEKGPKRDLDRTKRAVYLFGIQLISSITHSPVFAGPEK